MFLVELNLLHSQYLTLIFWEANFAVMLTDACRVGQHFALIFETITYTEADKSCQDFVMSNLSTAKIFASLALHKLQNKKKCCVNFKMTIKSRKV